MRPFRSSLINGLLFAALIGSAAAEEIPAGLNGATGNIFKVDTAAQTFELLKETEYDPKTDIGKSRFTIHWDNRLEITWIGELTGFDGIEEPVFAKFYGIDAPNRKEIGAGRGFEARVAEIHTGVDKDAVGGVSENGNEISGWFTPSQGKNVHSGTIRVGGKPVPVSLRSRNWKIFHHQPVRPGRLAGGFWKATLHGAEIDGNFVVERMEVSALEDPRASDDPKLPRVLVIGDSISMNYDESAKAALKGVANYHRNEGNSFSSVHGVNNAELWLGNYQEEGRHWDVIQFNHGLHDLKQAYDKASDTFGEYAVSKELYKASLEKEIAILKKTGAKLIWCSTTPVPTDIKSEYARRKGAAKEFNEAALEVMERHPEILINDLYGVVDGSPVFDGWRKTSDVHFYKPEEQKALGEAVAAAVLKALGNDSPTTKGIIDPEKTDRPEDAVDLVGEKGYDMIPDGVGPGKWEFKDGILTASPQWDSVVTKEPYGDFRMHVEFNVNDTGDTKNPEGNGNSGVYIQERYEVQILNSFGISAEDYKPSYGGSIYKQKKPDLLVSKKAGEWQTYDIAFRAARFEGEKKTEDARITVYHNGELIHDDYAIVKQTGAGKKEGPEPGLIKLQGHHNPVRFRNVWIQPLKLD